MAMTNRRLFGIRVLGDNRSDSWFRTGTTWILSALLLMVSAFLNENVFASDQLYQFEGKNPPLVEIVNPKKHEVVQAQPVSISIKFNGPTDPASFRAFLNKNDVSKRFTVTAVGAQASLGVADGLLTVPKKDNDLEDDAEEDRSKSLVKNKITINVRDITKKHEHKAERKFYFKSRPLCSQPPIPPSVPVGTEPLDEPKFISEATAVLEGASPATFTPVGVPLTFRLTCPTLKIGADTVIVYDNGMPLPFASLTLTADGVTLATGISSGRHELHLLAQDVFGATIDQRVVLWAGSSSIPVLVVDEAGAPVAGATVTAKLSDDPRVTATLTTDAAGRGTFANLPNRSYNLLAKASGNRIATRPASVSDGLVTLRLLGFKPASAIDNNDFSQGTAGWEIGSAPVTIISHVEGPLGISAIKTTTCR